MNLDVTVSRPDAVTAVVAVSGEIDVATTPQLRSTLHDLADEDGVRLVVADLDGVDFIDSSGLGVLIGCSRRLRSRGEARELRLVCSRLNLLRVFEITGLDGVFRIFSSVPDALKD
ncbi:MAG TPA: STAS domain-containing protein [Acidimicrobiales bacterium]|nr:STAS domain-containing protein [Acidimicrobiales bacterium]